MKVLIVDDSRAVQAFVRSALSEPTYQLASAGHGKQALEKVISFEPQLILLDWEMPEMNGPEFLKSYRSTGDSVPVIMMTTKNDPSEIAQVIDLGANEYIMKPFTPEILREKIAQVLGG